MSELLPSRQNEGYEACDDESGGLLQRTHFSDALLDYSAAHNRKPLRLPPLGEQSLRRPIWAAPPFAQGRLWALPRQWGPGRALDHAAMGAPGKPSVSGFAGERRSSGATALSAHKAETKDAELATTKKGDLEWTTWNRRNSWTSPSWNSRWSRR